MSCPNMLTTPEMRSSSGVQNSSDREHELLPAGVFRFETPAPGARQRVHPGAPVVLRRHHLGLDIAPQLETMEGGIERPLARVQPLARSLSNAIGDPPAVIGAERQDL